MKTVRACVLAGFGINTDTEMAEAFRLAGCEAERVHIRDLLARPETLASYAILAFPGGFSFGDHLGSGKAFASLCKKHLRTAIDDFINRGKVILGICNGFQALVKMGVLPNCSGDWSQEVSLIHNDSGVFEDRWVRLRFNPDCPSVWTKGLDVIELPARHGEGKFVVRDRTVEETLAAKGLIACTYAADGPGPAPYPANPNGSLRDIAGITDATGRIFGLMPHPEAFIIPHNHPRWTREKRDRADGLLIFERGVSYARSVS